MTNYAKKIAFKLFSPPELQGSNCSGLKGKKPLEKENRMDMIKSAAFKKYNVLEDEKKSWVIFRKAIDSSIRHCKHSPADRGRYTYHIEGQFHFGFILFL